MSKVEWSKTKLAGGVVPLNRMDSVLQWEQPVSFHMRQRQRQFIDFGVLHAANVPTTCTKEGTTTEAGQPMQFLALESRASLENSTF